LARRAGRRLIEPENGMRRLALGLIAVVALAASAPMAARAQAYPTRVIKLIVPAGPAGPTDLLARLLADRMGAALGNAVIVENRGGGGGGVGARPGARGEAGGYTLLFGQTAAVAHNPAVSPAAQ